jgi:hypothetical protein
MPQRGGRSHPQSLTRLRSISSHKPPLLLLSAAIHTTALHDNNALYGHDGTINAHLGTPERTRM